jgi:hypothetical protein
MRSEQEDRNYLQPGAPESASFPIPERSIGAQHVLAHIMPLIFVFWKGLFRQVFFYLFTDLLKI